MYAALVFNKAIDELYQVLVLQIIKVLTAHKDIVEHVVEYIRFDILLQRANCFYKLCKVQYTLLFIVLTA